MRPRSFVCPTPWRCAATSARSLLQAIAGSCSRATAKLARSAESSLLARARLAGLPVVALERHYRSRHPSLIAWSNAFSYEFEVEAQFGPVLVGGCRLRCGLCRPARRLQRDLAQVNVEEAEAIAAECLKWARDGRRTVGVAALTQGQRDLIRETVERELGKAGLSAATAGPDNQFFSKEEPFFIRTAGAVQGEERDVMMVSLGVAPNAEGKISQHTGALSRPDGLAVANVLLSRARLRTVVYSRCCRGRSTSPP